MPLNTSNYAFNKSQIETYITETLIMDSNRSNFTRGCGSQAGATCSPGT
jgi:hypothetical protein